MGPVDHPAFSLVHSAGFRPASVRRGGKRLRERGSYGSVIARCIIPWGGLRFALRKDAGVMVISDPS